jgi:hypothetical protein
LYQVQKINVTSSIPSTPDLGGLDKRQTAESIGGESVLGFLAIYG